MISSLRGTVLEKNLADVTVDVNGVGYRVALSLLSLSRLPDEGQPVKLRIRTVVREDALDLYGFLSRAEEELFLMLTSVSHVGPKLALAVLSGLELETLVEAIARGEVGRLTKIHGVGKKTAERLVLELKDKVKAIQVLLAGESGGARASGGGTPQLTQAREDLVSALVNLGYKPQQAEKAADVAQAQAGSEAGFEILFRESLKALRQNA